MSRLLIHTANESEQTVERLYKELERRIVASPPGLCPVDLALNFLRLCHSQTCGKCVPCRIGLGQLADLIEKVLNGEATMETLEQIERLADDIDESAFKIFYEILGWSLDGKHRALDAYRLDRLEPSLELLRLDELLDYS